MASIIIVSKDNQVNSKIDEYLKDFDEFQLSIFSSTKGFIEKVYDAPPSLIIMDSGINLKEYVKIIRDDPIFSNLPTIVLLEKGQFIDKWDDYPVDDFLFKPIERNDLVMRILLSIQRSLRVVEMNPLTMLPGNTPIIKTIQSLLDRSEQFALGYADLDNFKPYNDKYGFTRGDEVIRMTGRLIANMVKAYDPNNCFVGHVGGDDFVFISSPEKVESISKEIISNFDRIIPSFYDAEDRKQNHIISYTRDGKKKIFPLLTISIAIAINRGWFHHYGEINAAIAKVKKYAKSSKGSVYRIDRRNYEKQTPSSI